MLWLNVIDLKFDYFGSLGNAGSLNAFIEFTIIVNSKFYLVDVVMSAAIYECFG